jgi:CHAT domain-containing protein
VEAQEASLRADGSQAGVIHLACHGEHERHHPMRSRLLLAPGGGEDGRITAEELAALDLGSAALVTLAGCETGLSRALGGDDLAGFPRAVLESGAAAFLGSLWPVDDDTAGEFFRAFHARYRETRDPRAALRRARLDALADPERRSPRHWAPWTLLENAWKAPGDAP